MKINKGMGDFFALDIGTNAVRVVQLSKSGENSWRLQHHGRAALAPNISTSDAPEARKKLGEVILTAIGQSGIKTKNVVIGLPSSKTFSTVIDMPFVSESELKSTMKYQVDQYIPMPIDQAKVDWALLGQSLRKQNEYEVLITSVANAYTEDMLEFVEGLGLNVIAAEPDPIAMSRSLTTSGTKEALLLIDMGEMATDLAIVYGDAPRLIRSIPTGLTSLVKVAVSSLNVQEDQARQFILKFGLTQEKLDGQVAHALDNTLDSFAGEITKSIKFFQTRYPDVQISSLVLAGFSTVIPSLDQYLSNKVGMRARAGNPWGNVSVPNGDQANLAPYAAEFATAVGLAERSNAS